MDKFKIIKLKRLWNNLASTRDYIIKDCQFHGLGIRFELNNGEFMEIPCNELEKKGFKTSNIQQKSRYGKNYYLIDFAWRPQIDKGNKQEALF